MAELSLSDLEAYRGYLDANPEEWGVLDAICRISISRFWRDAGVFEHLGDSVLPALAEQARDRDPPVVRCWSAGCASGEEPYSLSILWHAAIADRVAGVSLLVTATDSNRELLARALRACYPPGCIKGVPDVWRQRAFLVDGTECCLRAPYRVGVEFVRQDIREAVPNGPFDLVLCRNLAFTYFDAAGQRAVAEQIARHMAPGGQLIIGMHERLPDDATAFEPSHPHLPVYRLSGAACRGSARETVEKACHEVS